MPESLPSPKIPARGLLSKAASRLWLKRANGSSLRTGWFVLVAAAYLLRLILMPMTGHNDLLLPAWKAHYINQGHWNIYAYLAQRDEVGSVATDHPPAAYPYGFYATTAGWLEVLRRAGLISFDGWSTQWAIPSRAWWFLLLKLPYLASDLAIGILLFHTAPAGRRLLAWASWAWSLSGAYLLLMGQNDLYPTLFTAGAAWLGGRALQAQRANQSRHESALLAAASMALLGLGATFKIIPLALAAPFALVLASRWRDRLLLTVIPAVIFGASAAPFIATPAFVNGVLFNWEGVRIFSAAQIFAAPVSLFVMAYVALLIVLVARPASLARPVDLWLIGAVVFSSLFLFSWSQFYWAVWLTPFVVALLALDAGRWRYWLTLWLTIEATFAVLLFSLHRDFSIGLLASASLSFRLAQFDAVIALFAPALRQPVEILWTVARSAQTTGRLLVFAGALGLLLFPSLAAWGRTACADFHQIRLSRWAGLLILPMLASLLVAAGIFALSGRAIGREYVGPRQAQRAVLSAEQPAFTQTLPPVSETLTGVLLNILPAESAALPSTMEVCVTVLSGEQCSQGSLIQSASFNGYGFRFSQPATTGNQPLRIVFRLTEPAAETRIVAPLASPTNVSRLQDYRFEQGQTALTAHLGRLTLLRPFETSRALAEVANHLTRDWRLAAMWPLIAVACLIVIGGAVRVAPDKPPAGGR